MDHIINPSKTFCNWFYDELDQICPFFCLHKNIDSPIVSFRLKSVLKFMTSNLVTKWVREEKKSYHNQSKSSSDRVSPGRGPKTRWSNFSYGPVKSPKVK